MLPWNLWCPTLCSSALMHWARWLTQSWEDECCFTVMSRAQCHSCKQSHGSVLADLTKSALPATKKGLKLFLAGVKASFRLLIGLSSHPGANMLNRAHNLFCCYHSPAASVSKVTHSYQLCSLCHTFWDFHLFDPPMHSRVNYFIYELCKQIISTMTWVIVMFLFLHIHLHVHFIEVY